MKRRAFEKQILLITISALAMVLTACVSHEIPDAETGDETPPAAEFSSIEEAIKEIDVGPGSTSEPICYDFEAQYIRTNGWQDGEKYPKAIPISTRIDLEDYFNRNKDIYDLKKFESAIEKYDEDWFNAGQMLLIVVVEEGSGSIGHEATCLTRDYLTIDRTIPEVGTADMAEWHILVETDMGNISDGFRIVFTENQPGKHFFGFQDELRECPEIEDEPKTCDGVPLAPENFYKP